MNNINNIILKISKFIFCISILINSTVVLSEDINPIQDPVQFLHKVTDRVLTELKHHKNGDMAQIDKVVNNLILPNVDFEEMCKYIAGRGIWSKASEADQNEFAHELKRLLTKTYSSTLNDYTNEKIEFQNYNGDLSNKRIQIKSTVVRPNKENLSVEYRLVAVADSWKVYDLIIEGVSILQGFRAQFSEDIKINGLKKVSEKIKNHNLKQNNN